MKTVRMCPKPGIGVKKMSKSKPKLTFSQSDTFLNRRLEIFALRDKNRQNVNIKEMVSVLRAKTNKSLSQVKPSRSRGNVIKAMMVQARSTVICNNAVTTNTSPIEDIVDLTESNADNSNDNEPMITVSSSVEPLDMPLLSDQDGNAKDRDMPSPSQIKTFNVRIDGIPKHFNCFVSLKRLQMPSIEGETIYIDVDQTEVAMDSPNEANGDDLDNKSLYNLIDCGPLDKLELSDCEPDDISMADTEECGEEKSGRESVSSQLKSDRESVCDIESIENTETIVIDDVEPANTTSNVDSTVCDKDQRSSPQQAHASVQVLLPYYENISPPLCDSTGNTSACGRPQIRLRNINDLLTDRPVDLVRQPCDCDACTNDIQTRARHQRDPSVLRHLLSVRSAVPRPANKYPAQTVPMEAYQTNPPQYSYSYPHRPPPPYPQHQSSRSTVHYMPNEDRTASVPVDSRHIYIPTSANEIYPSPIGNLQRFADHINVSHHARGPSMTRGPIVPSI